MDIYVLFYIYYGVNPYMYNITYIMVLMHIMYNFTLLMYK